jgi:hypothetical protein
LVTSPFIGFPPTILSVGPPGPDAGGGGGSAMANSVVSVPNAKNIIAAAISMTFGIPSPSFIIKITATIPDECLFHGQQELSNLVGITQPRIEAF